MAKPTVVLGAQVEWVNLHWVPKETQLMIEIVNLLNATFEKAAMVQELKNCPGNLYDQKMQ